MSLFQCENCGCLENTALTERCLEFDYVQDMYNWDGIKHLKGKSLCSACTPSKLKDGTPSEYGKWHDEFPRKYFAKGEYITNREGNMEHSITGKLAFLSRGSLSEL